MSTDRKEPAGNDRTASDDLIEGRAHQRVADSAALAPFEDILFAERPDWQQHVLWLLEADETEIVAWIDRQS